MKKIFIIFTMVLCPMMSFGDALDTMMVENTVRDNIKAKTDACRHGYNTALEKAKAVGKELKFFGDLRRTIRYVVRCNDHIVDLNGKITRVCLDTVSDFDKKGVFVNHNTAFIYTKDTDYATGDAFRNEEGFLFERVGNFKYKTVAGGTRSVPAYKITEYKWQDLSPKTYMKDKNIECKQENTKLEVFCDEDRSSGIGVFTIF